jgi:glucosamine-6-phosphate deaminase
MRKLTAGKLRVEIYRDRKQAAEAAALAASQAIAESLRNRAFTAVVFATGASQLSVLAQLTARADVHWPSVAGFHLDEYVGLPREHPASFRNYLDRNLLQRVPLGVFHEIDSNAADLEQTCRSYGEKLRANAPGVCLLGIGENGHLAFNDPAEADFNDAADVKLVQLDIPCRQQQVAEGWFDNIEQVPVRAITVTIPAIVRIPRLLVSVPGPRKAAIVRQTLSAPISPACPATILREHPNATLYLDQESASELSDEPHF